MHRYLCEASVPSEALKHYMNLWLLGDALINCLMWRTERLSYHILPVNVKSLREWLSVCSEALKHYINHWPSESVVCCEVLSASPLWKPQKLTWIAVRIFWSLEILHKSLTSGRCTRTLSCVKEWALILTCALWKPPKLPSKAGCVFWGWKHWRRTHTRWRIKHTSSHAKMNGSLCTLGMDAARVKVFSFQNNLESS